MLTYLSVLKCSKRWNLKFGPYLIFRGLLFEWEGYIRKEICVSKGLIYGEAKIMEVAHMYNFIVLDKKALDKVSVL